METLRQFRFVFVVALLAAAAAMAADRNRLHPALRALRRTLSAASGKASAERAGVSPAPPDGTPAWRRAVAFLLVLAAFAVAVCF